MSHDPILLVTALGRATLWLAAAGLITATVLRLARPNWPTPHRLAWLLTLLVGWTLVRFPIAVPWYAAPRDASPGAAQPAAALELAPIDAAPDGGALSVESGAQRHGQFSPAGSAEASAAPLDVVFPDADTAIADLAPPATPGIDWPLAILGVWLAGMGAMIGAWLIGYLWFVRTLRMRVPADATWQTEWSDVLAGAGVRQAIPLSSCGELGPVLCRLPRGYELLVPARLWRELDAGGRRAILRHELAHYRRGDVWKSLAARLLALPHWFNPVAWWAVRRFDDAAEWACDRAATAGEPATDYARALVRLGEQPGSFGYGAAARGRSLAARVRRVLAGPPRQDSTMKKTCLAGVGLALAAMSIVQLDLVARQPTAKELDAAGVAAGDEPQSSGKARDDAAPAAKMVEQAKRAYEAYHAAYEAETVTMPVVYEWSRRWMEAAQAAATDQASRAAAVRDHLERMQDLHKKIAKLYEVGTRGGEATEFAATSFYVAEAERWLQVALAAAGREPRTATFYVGDTESRPPDAKRAAETQAIDLKIKIAELRGQLEQTEIQLTAAKVNRDAAYAANTVSGSVKQRLEADCGTLESQLRTLKEQLDLYNQKLKLATSGAAPAAPKAATQSPTTKADLLYNGRNFDSWADDLQNDLSPGRRTEAIHALAAFGAKGEGRAAAAILAAIKDYSVSSRDGSPEGQLKDAALSAFGYPGYGQVPSIPREDSLPLLQEAVKSDNANQRLFAATVLPLILPKMEEAVPLMTGMVTDSNAEVRRTAASWLLKIAPKTPGVIDVVREALRSKELSTMQWGLLAFNKENRDALAPLAPDLVGIMDRTLAFGFSGPNAHSALVELGPAAIPALEEAIQSNEGEAKKSAQTLLELIRAADQPNAEPQPAPATP